MGRINWQFEVRARKKVTTFLLDILEASINEIVYKLLISAFQLLYFTELVYITHRSNS